MFLFLRKELFSNPQVFMTMADLSSRLVASMNSLGIVLIKESSKKHIESWRVSLLGDLHIFPGGNGKLLLYPETLFMCELAKEN